MLLSNAWVAGIGGRRHAGERMRIAIRHAPVRVRRTLGSRPTHTRLAVAGLALVLTGSGAYGQAPTARLGAALSIEMAWLLVAPP